MIRDSFHSGRTGDSLGCWTYGCIVIFLETSKSKISFPIRRDGAEPKSQPHGSRVGRNKSQGFGGHHGELELSHPRREKSWKDHDHTQISKGEWKANKQYKSTVGGGFTYFLFSPRTFGKDSILTSIFKGFETTNYNLPTCASLFPFLQLARPEQQRAGQG